MPEKENEYTNTPSSQDPSETEEVADSIEALEQGLYSRREDAIRKRERRRLRQRDFGVSDSWKDINGETDTIMKARRPIAKVLLIGALVFFALSILFSSYFWFQGVDISPENVAIEIQGPTVIEGGEELDLQITIKNNNPVPMEIADLIIEYPDGTHSAANIDVELPRYQESLGAINPGQEVRRTVEAVLFGEENTTKQIDVSVRYTVRGSNAEFYANSVYELSLSTSPLTLVIDSLEEAISGQEVEFSATVTSNSASTIRDVMVRVDYPFGFEFQSASPEPVFANRTWYLGDIDPEEEREITIRGTLVGQDGDRRVFRFAAGIQSENDENVIGAEFINTPQTLVIQRPFITADLTLNGSSGDVITSESGERVRGTIKYTNNLPTQIFDGEIEIVFSGEALNEVSIDSNSGFYRSIDNTLVWNRDTLDALRTIPSGSTGQVSFNFNSHSLVSGATLRNPEIKLEVNVRGKRLSDSNVPQEVTSSLSKRVRLSSDLTLTSKAQYATGPFSNSGPIPPQVEKETTYTVVLTVLNSSNDVANAQLKTTLPPYVEWLGTISPLTENVTYTPVGGRIIWNLGEVKAGTGISLPARELAFQVKLLPSISQIGQVPILVNEQTLTGIDRFTEENLSATRGTIDTRISESGTGVNSGIVVP